MLINEAKKKTGLTKKAIEYYCDQKLITPTILENGYRNFSHQDIKQLTKISTLRRLGIGTSDIRLILSDKTNETLLRISTQKMLESQREVQQSELIKSLADTQNYSEVEKRLASIEKNYSIQDNLLCSFPGFYGRFITMHFSNFLNEIIKTDEQKIAYDTIQNFLDTQVNLIIPSELQNNIDDITSAIDNSAVEIIDDNMVSAIKDTQSFLKNNQDLITTYLAYKQSDDYLNSPGYQMQQLIQEFNATSGYYDIFIPALKVLSPSYREYLEQIEEANKIFLSTYPELEGNT